MRYALPVPRKIPYHRPPSSKAPGRKVQQVRREAANQRGYTWRWRKYSKRRLQEHPWCVHCEQEGIAGLAHETDHIEPVSGPDDPRFWDPENHQSLCGTHHKRKTVTEDGGFGNQRQPRQPCA